ncbi:50S ribosomal protein L13 [Anaplasma bovis]|uniref:50S ribosomal protein L13 n=1 Tax=Anaplasma bovis TaxID=186733 RepID=UPI002FF3F87C
MRTFSIKAGEISKRWILIDAKDMVVGRLAAYISSILRGKHKPEYTPHMDCGDNVIVVNADLVRFTGGKRKDKVYYRHTGYPGGLKSKTPDDIFRSGCSSDIVKLAVWRMLGDGVLARKRFRNLKVYGGAEHAHGAQMPVAVDFGALNRKNGRREDDR